MLFRSKKIKDNLENDNILKDKFDKCKEDSIDKIEDKCESSKDIEGRSKEIICEAVDSNSSIEYEKKKATTKFNRKQYLKLEEEAEQNKIFKQSSAKVIHKSSLYSQNKNEDKKLENDEVLDEIPDERVKPNIISLIPLAGYIKNEMHFCKYKRIHNTDEVITNNSLIKSMKKLASLTLFNHTSQ